MINEVFRYMKAVVNRRNLKSRLKGKHFRIIFACISNYISF